MAIFRDNFNRANANLEDSATASSGGTWTHDGLIAGALTISSNFLFCATTNSTGSAYFAKDHGSKNHYVQFDVISTQNSTGAFFACRLGDRNNFVGVRAGFSGTSGVVEVYRRVAGTLTQLYISPGHTVAIPNHVRLEVQDDTWTVFINDVQLSTGSIGDGGALDANTKAGVVGRVNGTRGIGDNFETGLIGQVDVNIGVAGTSGDTGLSVVEAEGHTGVTVDATGSEATGSAGDIGVALPTTISATGVHGTGSVGEPTITAVENTIFLLTGLSAAAHAGGILVTSDNTVPVTGLGMVAHIGALGVGHWFPVDLSGIETWTRINP
jgi:hypothetical protein